MNYNPVHSFIYTHPLTFHLCISSSVNLLVLKLYLLKSGYGKEFEFCGVCGR